MSTWGRRFCRAFSIKLAIFQRNRRIPRTDLRFLPVSSSNHNYKDGNEDTEIYEQNKYFELEQHISSGAFVSGGVLDISLGGEVRRGPSYPDPV